MQPKRISKEPVQLTIDETLLDQAREAALMEGRTLSNWLDRQLGIEFPAVLDRRIESAELAK